MYSQPYIYLIVFFLIISLLSIFIRLDKKSIKALNILVGTTFIVFFGLRGFIGWDWHTYFPYFKDLPTLNHFNKTGYNFEVGFSLFTSIIKTINPNYHFFIFINTLVDFVLLNIFFRRYLPNYLYAFAFLSFIVMEGLVVEVNLIRNIKGILLFLLSLKYIENRNLTKFLLINIIGVTFHWSSVIFLPLYFFLSKKLDLRIFIAIFIIGNIVYLLQIQFVKPIVEFVAALFGETAQSRAEIYLGSSTYNSLYGITIGYIERIATSILIMIYYNTLIEKSRSNIMFINAFIIFFVVYFYFSEVSIIVSRIGILFFFSYWVLWPLIIDLSTNVSKYIFFIALSVYMNLRIIKMTNNILFRYDNVVFGQFESHKDRVKTFNKYSKKIQNQK